MMNSRQLSPADISARSAQQASGIGAETVLRAVGPMINERVETLILQLVQCDPVLEKLLDLRAKLAEAFRIQTELKNISERGKEAVEALADIFNPRQ